MTSTPAPDGAEQGAADVQRIQLISHLYPRYRMFRRTDRHGRSWWWAIREGDPPAGMYQSIGRTNLDGLLTALAKQDWLMHVQRGRRT